MIDYCSWNSPGADPYMGPVPAAIEKYQDIPSHVRAKLRAAMESRSYDDIVFIKRDTITGSRGYEYEPTISHMHFGSKGKVCQSVDRSKWAASHKEMGLVYCAYQYCILVPTVCRNVSRVYPMMPDEYKPKVAPKRPVDPEVKLPHNKVPVPSSLPLVLTGFVILAFLRRRM